MSVTSEQVPTTHRRLICCLLAVEITEHATKQVFDQIRLTQDFRQLLADATARSTAHDLVSIVSEDGALLSFLADAKACCVAALGLREATSTQDRYCDLHLRIGVSLGTVETVEDEFGHPCLSGEGRRDAERVMRQAPSGQIRVARCFFELLSRTAPEVAKVLDYQSVLSDTSRPSLGLYPVHPEPDAEPGIRLDRSPATAESAQVGDFLRQPSIESLAAHAQSNAEWLHRFQWAWSRYALVPILIAVSVVFMLSGQSDREWSGLKPAARRIAAAPPAHTVAEAVAFSHSTGVEDETTRAPPTAGAAVLAVPAKSKPVASLPTKPRSGVVPVARNNANGRASADARGENPTQALGFRTQSWTPVASAPPPIKSGTLHLAVKPWGEVYVDGSKVGITPPLKSLEASPGRHVITIRNGALPIYQKEVTVHPDTKVTVAHEFSCASTHPGFSPPSGRSSTMRLIC